MGHWPDSLPHNQKANDFPREMPKPLVPHTLRSRLDFVKQTIGLVNPGSRTGYLGECGYTEMRRDDAAEFSPGIGKISRNSRAWTSPCQARGTSINIPS
jgi:hypothetical protein